MIISVWEECNLTAPQFIFDEFIEQLKGKVMLATDQKVQFSEIILLLTGQFSAISISPSNVKLKFSKKKFPEGDDELLMVFETSHDLPMI